MNILYAYPAEKGQGVEAEILGILRDRFGNAVQTAREERDAERGDSTDVFVTVEMNDRHGEAVIDCLRAHPAVIDAAQESFGERV
ncbi:hypothetical protein [Azospirillum sp. SYSU D00513]|uniref:hypothetical protein n=1 Tax=Azospirillum sp. SYSU D00513 TaxID=2812561 RepID=UPI001A95C778|nr:hypothetical protein [Azospirillum sp. SYSU D00513]